MTRIGRVVRLKWPWEKRPFFTFGEPAVGNIAAEIQKFQNKKVSVFDVMQHPEVWKKSVEGADRQTGE